ncbi:methyltransferase domain-containing protein [Kocuria sp.]|uniref:methyltransferase domain-containing protein n=1 Tax=Kocuria sp. TaxID=1871328 RepID=UPI0026DEBEFE|nr:methyltransferase domain-containing protein [Kocuria sp.]MDO5368444.1 methyltransferase domain-containing protein [Kocuria sp.]
MSFYSHGHAPSVLASHGTRRAADSAAYLLPELSPGVSLLDIGCGPGSITLDLAETVAPGRVIGMDQSLEAITSAADAARERGLPNVIFRIADVYALPFEDGSFDIVHAHQVLQHLPDPVAALREMSRVCTPNGLIAVRDADYASMAWFPQSAGLSRWLELYRSMARANRGEPDAGRHLKSWARMAGLRDTRVTTSSWSYASARATRWWGESWAGRVRASSYGDRALELGLSTQPELDGISAAWEVWSKEPDAWFAMLHTEILARPALPTE